MHFKLIENKQLHSHNRAAKLKNATDIQPTPKTVFSGRRVPTSIQLRRLQLGISSAELAFSVLRGKGKIRPNERDWKSFGW